MSRVFLCRQVFAQSGEDVLDAMGGAGVADDLKQGQLELVLQAFETAVVIDEMEERFFGVADENGEVEGDAKHLPEGRATVFLGM